MSDESKEFSVRLSKAAKEFNVAVSTIQEFLAKKGFQGDFSPNTKLTKEMYDLVVKEYQGEKEVKTKPRNWATCRIREVLFPLNRHCNRQKMKKTTSEMTCLSVPIR